MESKFGQLLHQSADRSIRAENDIAPKAICSISFAREICSGGPQKRHDARRAARWTTAPPTAAWTRRSAAVPARLTSVRFVQRIKLKA
eukprot:6177411-Pleurochrysis_carterae.AAC.1